MRAALGLPQPERRIGLSAHDFAAALGAERVLLTRAEREGGAPTVPSRWLARLDALFGYEPGSAAAPPEYIQRGRRSYLAWAEALDRPDGLQAVAASRAARRRSTARPTRLSVSSIEQWRRDPYGLYARRILGLEALDPLEAELGAADRGSALHDALDEFLKAHPSGLLPPDAHRALRGAGREASRPTPDGAGRARLLVAALPAPGALVRGHRERPPRRRHASCWRAKPTAPSPSDRAAGRCASRRAPTASTRSSPAAGRSSTTRPAACPRPSELDGLFAPQLLLEAAMAEHGGFDKIKGKARAVHLSYWQANGLGDGGEVKEIKGSDAAGAGDAGAGRARWPSTSPSPARPIAALPWPEFIPHFNDYAHLERVAEWSTARRRRGMSAVLDRAGARDRRPAARHDARPLGLGRGQCRHRQDQGADRSRDAPAARRRASPSASSASPSPRRPPPRCATGWPASSAAGRWPTRPSSTRRSRS